MVDALQLMHRAAGRNSAEPCRTLTHMKCTTTINYLPHWITAGVVTRLSGYICGENIGKT